MADANEYEKALQRIADGRTFIIGKAASQSEVECWAQRGADAGTWWAVDDFRDQVERDENGQWYVTDASQVIQDQGADMMFNEFADKMGVDKQAISDETFLAFVDAMKVAWYATMERLTGQSRHEWITTTPEN